MLDCAPEVRESRVHTLTQFEALGLTCFSRWSELIEADFEMLAGDPVAAEHRLRAAQTISAESGDKLLGLYATANLALALHEQRRYDEALRVTETFGETHCDRALRAKQLGVRAQLLARVERTDEAEALAEEAVHLAGQTDSLVARAEALIHLAEVLELAGKSAEAISAVEAALGFHERKGNVIASARARVRLAELGARALARPL